MNSDEEICAFIDRYISAATPDKDEDPELYEIVTSVQQHGHRPTCQKKPPTKEEKEALEALKKSTTVDPVDKERLVMEAEEDSACRFHYPLPCREYTSLDYTPLDVNGEMMAPRDAMRLKEPEWMAEAKLGDLDAEKTETYMNNMRRCFLSSCKVRQALKRGENDRWTNVHNTCVLRCWKGNMDLQYTPNMYALLGYVCRLPVNTSSSISSLGMACAGMRVVESFSYVAKPERELGELLKQFQSELDINMSARKKLQAVANRFLQARKVSAQVRHLPFCLGR